MAQRGMGVCSTASLEQQALLIVHGVHDRATALGNSLIGHD